MAKPTIEKRLDKIENELHEIQKLQRQLFSRLDDLENGTVKPKNLRRTDYGYKKPEENVGTSAEEAA